MKSSLYCIHVDREPTLVDNQQKYYWIIFLVEDGDQMNQKFVKNGFAETFALATEDATREYKNIIHEYPYNDRALNEKNIELDESDYFPENIILLDEEGVLYSGRTNFFFKSTDENISKIFNNVIYREIKWRRCDRNNTWIIYTLIPGRETYRYDKSQKHETVGSLFFDFVVK